MTAGAAWLVVIDHQRVFADPASPWAADGFEQTVPVVADLAAQHGDRVVRTRWVPAAGTARAGSWTTYLRSWPFADRPADAEMFDLVPSATQLPGHHVVTAHTFGKWGHALKAITGPAPRLTLVGVATDCCVLSTALAAADAGGSISVVASGCAGSSPANHRRALDVMALYDPQIQIV